MQRRRHDVIRHIWGNTGVRGIAGTGMRSFIQSITIRCTPIYVPGSVQGNEGATVNGRAMAPLFMGSQSPR